MRKLVLIAGIILFILSCSHKDKLPKDILSKQQMRGILWDLVKTNEYLNGFPLRDSSTDKTVQMLNWYDNIYRLHKTNKAQFEKSYAYYREHSPLMKEVLDSISHEKEPINPQVKKDSVAIKDSIIKADSVARKRNLPAIKTSVMLRADSIRRARRIFGKHPQ
ncbi:MAG: DUF4296 domain-containing protein [Chitinophagaceae bacterium]